MFVLEFLTQNYLKYTLLKNNPVFAGHPVCYLHIFTLCAVLKNLFSIYIVNNTPY